MKSFGRAGTRLSCLILFLTVVWGAAPTTAAFQAARWTLSEFQPEIKAGGRANGIAVHPTRDSEIFVASESGGLFHSRDRGLTWRHVDSLPCYTLSTVAFLPGDPSILLVATRDDLDFKATGGGGVWRSTNGGRDWGQAPAPNGVTGRITAYEISVEPVSGNIYVGTNVGLFVSTDRGASWTSRDVFGAGDRRVFAVVALGGGTVVAGGPSGVRRSTDGGVNWQAPATSLGGVADMHALGRSPLSNQHAYLVDGSQRLYYTQDGGVNWTQVTSAPGGGGSCGGIAFVKAALGAAAGGQPRVDLYFSNRCGLARLLSPQDAAGRVNYSGAWENLRVDHEDIRDLAFGGDGQPLLLGSDGGLHRTNDGGANWTFVGGGRGGYNALQLTDVAGQRIRATGAHDLYFGTQDNSLWSSHDGGRTWPFSVPAEGFFIELERDVPTASDSQITFVTCVGCANRLSGPNFAGVTEWSNPSPTVAGNPAIVRRSYHVQAVNDPPQLRDDPPWFRNGLAVTRNLGASWQQFAIFPETPAGLPVVASPGGPASPIMLYQAIQTGATAGPPGATFNVLQLTRIIKQPSATRAEVYYPTMNNFGGLGLNPTMFAWYPVYAVDPADPAHLIAPDVVNGRMMQSPDGGYNWYPMPELTSLVTEGGRLIFNNWMFPLVSTISFCPLDPNLVLLGTAEGGLYFSANNGATWARIEGSEKVTRATDIYWQDRDDILISTYGRGLWRLRSEVDPGLVELTRTCRPPCFFRPLERGDPFRPDFFYRRGDDPAAARALLVKGGQVQGARVEGGVLRELFVTPGSTVTFMKGGGSAPGIKVTETSKPMGFPGLESAPRPPQAGLITKGLIIIADNRLLGAVFDQPQKTLPLSARRLQPPRLVVPPLATAQNRPYLKVLTRTFVGGPVAFPNEMMQLAGNGFPPNSTLVVAIDGRPTTYRAQAGAQGSFRMQVPAPREMGLHRIEVRDGDGRQGVSGGSMFIVRPADEPARKQ
jgi:photosystem II stability/assembly factor-like uncharacterized protein